MNELDFLVSFAFVHNINYKNYYIVHKLYTFCLGQSDIKKLRRENEQLRKEIWCLRDEYDKLDKLLKEKETGESGTSCSSDSVRNTIIISKM